MTTKKKARHIIRHIQSIQASPRKQYFINYWPNLSGGSQAVAGFLLLIICGGLTGSNTSVSSKDLTPTGILIGGFLGFIGIVFILDSIAGVIVRKFGNRHQYKHGFGKFAFVVAVLLYIRIVHQALSMPAQISSPNQAPAELASEATQLEKAKYKFPYEVDSVTTLTDISSLGDTIMFHYTIHGADASNLSTDTLESSIKPTVCANSSTKELLTNGVNVQYNYIVKETGAPYSFTISEADCKK